MDASASAPPTSQEKRQKEKGTRPRPPHSATGCCSDDAACEAYGPAVVVKATSLNRILYTNPVCLLTSVARRPSSSSGAVVSEEFPPRENVMTITWLTPTDTNGGLFLSMHADRHTVQNVLATRRFVLNIPVAGMEELAKAIGKCSGRDTSDAEDVPAAANEGGTANSSSDGVAAVSCPTTITTTTTTTTMAAPIIKSPPSKLDRLGIRTSSFAWKEKPPTPDSLDKAPDASLADVCSDHHRTLIEDVIRRSYVGDKGPTVNTNNGANKGKQQQQKAGGGSGSAATSPHSAEYQQVYSSIADSLSWGDVFIDGCVAHVVCEVVGIIPPLPPPSGGPTHSAVTSDFDGAISSEHLSSSGVIGTVGTAQHLSIFAQMKVGAVRKRYWTRGLLQPDSADLPPYLTFLGQGTFLHSTLPKTNTPTE